MADEIVIPPKVPVNPSGTPGVGGLAAIPSAIGAILGADDFCSVWNFPLSGICVADPDDPDRHGIPAWCLAWSDGPLCKATVVDETTGVAWNNDFCFSADYTKVPCTYVSNGDNMCTIYINYQTGEPAFFADRTYFDPVKNKWLVAATPQSVPCNDFIQCYDVNGIAVNCNWSNGKGGFINFIGLPQKNIEPDGRCFYINGGDALYKDCILDGSSLQKPDQIQFDKFMRFVDPGTGLPITNGKFNGGYPIPPEPEPEIKVPYDPGTNPFNPTLPDIPEGEECAGLICECIALVTNALGAVDNSIHEMKDNLASLLKIMNDRLFSIDTSLVAFLDYMETIIGDIDNPLGNGSSDILERILEAIDEISVEVVKEAGTNFWDVLGGAFGDIFDLIEFLIEQIIYLVIPENTAAISDAMDSMKSTLQGKVAPVHEIQQHITSAMNVEERSFENISVNLPKYGEVTFFKIDYLLLALPYIKMLMSASMILVTSIWAYRKISSEMVR